MGHFRQKEMIYSVYAGMDQFTVAEMISILFRPELKGPITFWLEWNGPSIPAGMDSLYQQ